MKIHLTYVWIIAFLFIYESAIAGIQNFESALKEISKSVEKIDKKAFELSEKDLSKIIDKLEKYDNMEFALPDTGQFVQIRAQLFEVFEQFDKLINNLALRQKHPTQVVHLAYAYFHVLDELEIILRKSFKGFTTDEQFIFMLPITQSKNAFLFGRINLVFLSSLVLTKIQEPESRKRSWELIRKMSDKIDYEKLAPQRTLYREYLVLTLERLLKFVNAIDDAFQQEQDETVKKSADKFATDLISKKVQFEYLYKKAKEWQQMDDAHNAGDWFEKGEKASDNDEKIYFYSHAIKLNPGLAPAYNNRGNAYLALHRFQEALADFDRVISLEPGNANAFQNRGNIYAEMGKPEPAIADYSKAIELKISGSQVYANRGNCYRNLKKYELAVADYDVALKLNPGDALTWNNRGICHRYLKNYEQAVRDHQKSIEISPSASAWFNLGSVFWIVRSWNEVVNAWENCLKLDPNHEAAKEWLAKAKKQRRF